MSTTGFDMIYSIDNQEYGFVPENFKPMRRQERITLVVPRIMSSLTATGTGNITTNKLFANDSECKINNQKSVKPAKAFTVEMQDSNTWMDKINSDGEVEKGRKFTVDFINGNIQYPYATTK